MTSEELRATINASALSKAELARRAGIAPTTVYDFARGDTQSLRIDAHQALEKAVSSSSRSPRGIRETGQPFEAVPVKVPVPADLAEMARRYGLDVEALVAEGGVPRLREAFKAAYIERHKEAIEWASDYVREHGTPSQQLGMI
ncbi:MAG: hypothetical protein AAGI03_02175 [Pseudomonadota bacterium]